MPQMKPLFWSFLFIYTLMIYMNTMIIFFFTKLFYCQMNKILNKNKFKFKYKW